MFGIRGAVQVERDSPEAIAAAVLELCRTIVEENALAPSEIVSAFFTLTVDLRSAFPAQAARRFGWNDVPMICAQEIDVPGSLPRVCRVLLHVRSERPPRHVYLGATRALRPDLP